MTLIRGVWGAVQDDGLTPYRNHAEDIRAAQWRGSGQGLIDGLDMSLDSGSLSVTFTPGEAQIEERGTDINGDGRGYHVFNDTPTQVVFDPPDASSRNDALVVAWSDPQYGAAGAAVSGEGPQIVTVRGTSGVTTPQTDTDINTAIGPGGWFRFANVVIDPGDTEVNPAGVTETWPHAYPYASLFGTSQLIGSGTAEVPVSFGGVTERAPVSMGDTANDQLVIPTAGVYSVELHVEWGNNNAGNRSLFLYQNASRIRGHRISAAPPGGDYLSIAVPSLRCDAGDTLTATTWQDSGANLSTTSKVLSARWVRR